MDLDIIYNQDCLVGMKDIPDGSIDLIVTDPPYEIRNTNAGNTNKLCKSIQGALNELVDVNLTKGFDTRILNEMLRVCKKPNIYIWCNEAQIPMFLDFFVRDNKCSFNILCWAKTNAVPTFNNKYLSDKEYCLYFRRGGYCQPNDYESARTVFFQPLNSKDKSIWGHPTIKPMNIIQTLIRNSSHEGDIILDCFMGSGTTAVAALREKRHYIGFEITKEYYDIACERIKQEQSQLTLF